MIDYVRNNYELILAAFGQHIALALIPVLIGAVVALPLGYLAVRRAWLYQPLVTISGVLYSIPSLALFVVLPLIIGTKVLSPLNIIVALAIYTVALLVRSVADALRSVDRNVTQAATAMGYRPVKRLFGVDLPIALPVMLAGLRVATVSNISLVSVGAIIGVGGSGRCSRAACSSASPSRSSSESCSRCSWRRCATA
ncbi:MAG: ABC transporter permease subunit [Geodermatophilaceae bacterium]